MTTRVRLPDRREAETFDLEAEGLRYRATIGRFEDGRLAEVFLTNHKAGSTAGIMASDAAVVASIALQYGAPVEVLRKALMRDSRGNAVGPLGVALDLVESEGHAVNPAEGGVSHDPRAHHRIASAGAGDARGSVGV